MTLITRAATIVPYPAACPSCKALAVDVLWSDATVPVYACGSTPFTVVCDPLDAPAFQPADRNLRTPTDDDLDSLAALVDVLQIAWTPVPSRVGLCQVMHCDQTAVDGRCNDHV